MKIHVPKNLGPQPVPPGVYQASVSKCTVKTTEKGASMIVAEYTIQSQGNDPEVKTIGRKIFDNLTIQENTLWRVNTVFSACTGTDLPEGDFTIDELIGIITNGIQNKNIMIKVDVETYEGIERNRIKEVKAVA